MDTKILCGVSEKGKIVVNKCLDKGIHINTIKLQQLLILMHGTSLAKYNEPLFDESVVVTPYGVRIEQIGRDFLDYAVRFDKKLVEYHCLLERQNAIVNDIIRFYGDKNHLEFNLCLQALNNYEGSKTIPNEFIQSVFIDAGYDFYGDIPSNGIQYRKK